MNFNDIDVDAEFEALSTGMEYEEEYEEEEDNDKENEEKQNAAILKQLEDEIDEEEKQKEKPNTDAFKADFSKQKVQPEPVLPFPKPTPQPSAKPASQPTAKPTPQPNANPTPQPTAKPAPQPSAKPAPEQPKQKVKPTPQQPAAQSPQKTTQTPPKSEKVAKEKPKPKPKPVIPDFVDEKANSEDYNEIFKTFTDSFYSMLHSKSNQQAYLDQIEKLLPIIANGPSQPIKDDIKLERPKLKAPKYRKYSEFKKNSISTALDQKDVDKVVKEIEEQIETLKKDAKNLLANKSKKFAAFIMHEIKVLKLSIIKIKQEPYYVTDVFKYFVPNINSDIPPNVMRVSINSGSGFPKSDIIVAVLVPHKEQGFFRVATPSVKGPNPNFNFKQDVPIDGLRSPVAFKRFFGSPSSIGIYVNVGKEIPNDAEPQAVSAAKTNCLMRHHTLTCPAITFQDIPGAMINIEFKTRQAISQMEMTPVEIRVKCSPFVIFARKPKAAAAAEKTQSIAVNSAAKQLSQNQKQATANSAAHKVPAANPQQQPPPQKAQMRDKEEIIKSTIVPKIHVLTDAELEMFWSGEVVMFLLSKCDAVKKDANRKKVPVQDGVINMFNKLSQNWEKVQDDIENDVISQEQYKEMIAHAVSREEARLNSIPEDDREIYQGFINMMKDEMTKV